MPCKLLWRRRRLLFSLPPPVGTVFLIPGHFALSFDVARPVDIRPAGDCTIQPTVNCDIDGFVKILSTKEKKSNLPANSWNFYVSVPICVFCAILRTFSSSDLYIYVHVRARVA